MKKSKSEIRADDGYPQVSEVFPKEESERILQEAKKLKRSVVNYTLGWVCPKCGRVNAPFIDQCTCEPDVYYTSHSK